MKLQKGASPFVFVLVVLLLHFSAFSRGCVYILDVNADVEWANTVKSQGHFVTELRDALRRLGYTPVWTHHIDNLKNCDYLICWDLPRPHAAGYLKKYPREKLIAFLWEPPTVLGFNYDKSLHNYFSKIYTWDDSLVGGKQYFQFYYPKHCCVFEFDLLFEEKKLCAIINCNKDSRHPSSLYGERRSLINFFEHKFSDDFDLYGRGWGSANLKNYKGEIDSKLYCLKEYRFYFAYENMRDVHGYVTEKIFDAFMAGCVPVYWGAKNITDYIPKECFIDRRDFKDNEELYWFLKNMSESEHQKYIDNIKRFLKSDQSLVFSIEYYINTVLSAIEPGYDKTVALTERQRGVVERAHFYL